MTKPLLSIPVWRYRFTPSLLPTLATLVMLPLLFSLGVWQLHRAQEKRELLAAFHASAEHPLSVEEVSRLAKGRDYRTVQLQGHFDNRHQLYLENRFYHHQLGFQVLTPFVLKHGAGVILVNRGWLSQTTDLQQLAQVDGEMVLRGKVYTPTHNLFIPRVQLSESTSWPLGVQEVNIPQLSQVIGAHLYPYIVLLDADQAHGFARDWQPAVMPPSRHIGYAVQWFALALTLLVIYLSVNTRRVR